MVLDLIIAVPVPTRPGHHSLKILKQGVDKVPFVSILREQFKKHTRQPDVFYGAALLRE